MGVRRDPAPLDEITLGVFAALLACVFAASAQVTVRQLIYTERVGTIVLYFSLISSALALCTLPFGWIWPDPQQLALLIGAGVLGGIGQILLTESYRHAEVSLVAPFEYTSLLLSVVVGYVFFGDVPTGEMLTGALVLVAAGLLIIFRERQLGIERKARQMTPLQ